MPETTETAELRLGLAAATIEDDDDDTILVSAHGRLPLRAGPGVRAALHRLAEGGASEPALVELTRERGDASELAVLFYYLRSLDSVGQIARSVTVDGEALARIDPLTTSHGFALAELDDDRAVVLSRFAHLRRFDAGLVLESPTSLQRIRVLDPRVAAIVHALASSAGARVDSLETSLPRPATRLVLRALLGAGMVLLADDEREQQPPLATWSFHDLALHNRSRLGRHDRICGKTYPYRGEIEPLPAIKPAPAGRRVELPPPRDTAGGRSFSEVLGARRSVRGQGDAPITLAELGEFLHRAARVRGEVGPAAPPVDYEFSSRPSPGGGGCHELELYLAVNRCADLDSGLYHYDPASHRLTQITERTPELEALLSDAKLATASEELTQVLICVAARFARMSWPYEGIVYATTLKNVGALLQTMYLVATAMGLAPCAVGRGDARAFAKLAGLDELAETSVGEFMLGSRPPTRSP